MKKEFKIGDVVEVSYMDKNLEIISETTKVTGINKYGYYTLENGMTAKTLKKL